MQRMWMRAMAVAAVAAAGLMVADDVQAGHHRGGCGGGYSGGYGGGAYYGGYSGGYGGTYYTSNGGWFGRRGLFGRRRGGSNNYAYSRGYAPAYGATVYGGQVYGGQTYGGAQVYGGAQNYGVAPAGAEVIAPGDRSARTQGSAGARINGQTSPSDRTRLQSDADLRARSAAPGTEIRGRASGDADVDVNRNDGTFRGDANIRTREGADTTPPPVPNTPQAAPDTATPPPVPEARNLPEAPSDSATPAPPATPASDKPEAPAP
jgi:hypothetical protein